MTIPLSYDAGKVEQKWYGYWLKNKYFKAIPDSREPYTIVIPPYGIMELLERYEIPTSKILDFHILNLQKKS